MSVAPAMVMQAVLPSSRMELIMVVLCQRPQGAAACSRFPCRKRPRKRVRLIVALFSSSGSLKSQFWVCGKR